MLSSVLKSQRAVMVNIQIMRTFTRLREILSSHEESKQKLSQMERKYDAQFKVVFDAIRELMTPPTPPAGQRKKIGFQLKEPKAGYRSSPSPLTGEGRGGDETRKDKIARMKKNQSQPSRAKKAFPTHVGMNRSLHHFLDVVRCVPHTRGDEPID
jgi:hypothetical protein